MIDLRKKRDELQETVRKAQATRSNLADQINYLNGGIEILTELIADQERETPHETT